MPDAETNRPVQRVRAALRAAQVGIWEVDPASLRVHWSPEMYALYGLDARQLEIDLSAWMSRIHSKDRLQTRERIEHAIERQTELECSFRICLDNGEYRSMLLKGAPRPSENDQQALFVGTHWRIDGQGPSPRLEGEAGLRLELAARGAGVGVWDLNLQSNELIWDEQMFHLYGVSPADFAGAYEAWQACVHAEDLDRAHAEVQEAVQGLRNFHTEFRVVHPDGEVRHIKAIAMIQRNADGLPVRMLGTNWDVTGERVAEEKLRFLAYHDELTALPNRRLMRQCLEQQINRARERDERLAVLYLDLDHFKNVNDAYGHPFGDHVLRETAGRVRSVLRAQDTLARIGGDEFIAILHLPDVEASVSACQKILNALTHPMELDGIQHFLNASIGVAMYPDDGTDPDTLLQHADIALFRAKESGRGIYSFFAKELSARVIEQTTLQTELHIALAQGLLEVFYQPQFAICEDLRDAPLVGLEALVRWRHPTRGLVNPDQFIPIAETIGLIERIDQFVLRSAGQKARQWRHLLPSGARIAVNKSMKSPVSLDLPDDLVAELLGVEQNASACRLTIEVTESNLMQNPELSIGSLTRLKQQGFRIAIDDFGTGYSSLSYLKRLPIDYVKIDRSFIDELHRDSHDRAITSAIIAMARSLDLEVYAEGVETQSQLAFLAEIGCEYGQGHLYCAPLSAQETEALLVSQAETTATH